MIERIFIKDYLSFKNVELEFGNGLIAFTGASGAGKSLLMNALLSLFGIKDVDAKSIEVILNMPLDNLENIGIENEEINILRFIKEKKARYFINSQAISKKNMYEICSSNIRYLSVKDNDEFSSSNILFLLDTFINKIDNSYLHVINKYETTYKKYLHVKNELDKINEEEKKINELKEFAKFEISLIDEVDPKVGEDEELMEVKKSLSKKEKISQSMQHVNAIFEFERGVHEFLNLCDINSNFFDECMNELRVHLDDANSKMEQLDDVDIENLLQRIEKISKLKSRFGSILQTLEYKKQKQEQLKRYENIEFAKQNLQNEYVNLQKDVQKLANDMSKMRKKYLPNLQNDINLYLKKLYLDEVFMDIKLATLSQNGQDNIDVSLNNVDIKKVSSGELNRLRLAFIATQNDILAKKQQGILILDEIDANLSGKEAMSVANVLKQISQYYQVFAISHQPQLSSRANYHFLVEKKDEISSVKMLNLQQRVQELARMISGEEVKEEALEFAKKLLDQ